MCVTPALQSNDPPLRGRLSRPVSPMPTATVPFTGCLTTNVTTAASSFDAQLPVGPSILATIPFRPSGRY